MQNFDATNIPPQQSVGKHPEGTFPFQIKDTYAEETKAKDGGLFVVVFETPAGIQLNRYNLWNKNVQAKEIAEKELSALCHATGVFKLTMMADNFKMCGHELRGARGTIKIRTQPGNEQYSEVEKVFDANGQEPGKSGAAPQPQGQQSNWGAQGANANNPPANNNAGGWGTGGGQAQQPQQQQQPNNAGWQPGPTNNPAVQQGQQPQQGGAPKPPWA